MFAGTCSLAGDARQDKEMRGMSRRGHQSWSFWHRIEEMVEKKASFLKSPCLPRF